MLFYVTITYSGVEERSDDRCALFHFLLILRNTPASTTPAGILQELKEKQIK